MKALAAVVTYRCVPLRTVTERAVLVLQAAEKNLIRLIARHPTLASLKYTLGMGFASQGRLQVCGS